tara:strand:- start:27 stop:722 length:696 start_codon:yes stop_codon:yes gene_type:complete
MGSKNIRAELEVEASCRVFESGGDKAGTGHGYAHVNTWFASTGHRFPPCKDGKAKDGSLDRLGRRLDQGRGPGFDEVIPVEVVPGSIVEWVPVNMKDWSRGTNTDVTSGVWNHEEETAMDSTPLAAFLTALAAEIPWWVCMLKQEGDTLLMRRADARAVFAEANKRGLTYVPKRGAEKGMEVPAARLRVSGSGKYKGRYRRVSIQWSHVPADMWLDAEWVPFSTEGYPLPY